MINDMIIMLDIIAIEFVLSATMKRENEVKRRVLSNVEKVQERS